MFLVGGPVHRQHDINFWFNKTCQKNKLLVLCCKLLYMSDRQISTQLQTLLPIETPHRHVQGCRQYRLHPMRAYTHKHTHLILLPVFILIHWGIGRFCFCFLARKRLILKVLWDDWRATEGYISTMSTHTAY